MNYQDNNNNTYIYNDETNNLIIRQKKQLSMYNIYINILNILNVLKYTFTLSITNKFNKNKLNYIFNYIYIILIFI